MSETEQATSTPDGAQLASILPQANTSQPSENDGDPVTQETNGKSSDRPAGDYQERLDLNGLPEEIKGPVEARLKTLTKKMGNQERRFVSQIKERDELLSQQSRLIEELQNGMGAVVDHLQEGSLKDAETQIRQQIKTAHETGDTEAFIAANERLAEVKARKIALEQQKKTAKPKQEGRAKPMNTPASASQMADDAVADGDFDSEDARAVGAWQNETDSNGNQLRPWAHSRTPDNPTNDPRFRRGLIEAAAVFDESSPWANKSVAEKLAEVDRRMGVVRNTGTQNVMGGSLTSSKKTSKITLTPFQEQLAIRKKFGGPKAKSESEHLEAFRKQIEKVNASKGARK